MVNKIKWGAVIIASIINIIANTWGWKIISLAVIILAMEISEVLKPRRRGKFSRMRENKW